MNEYQYKTTSLPNIDEDAARHVSTTNNKVIRLMVRGKTSATVVVLLDKLGGNEVGLIPRMTRIVTKFVFVSICEISGKKSRVKMSLSN